MKGKLRNEVSGREKRDRGEEIRGELLSGEGEEGRRRLGGGSSRWGSWSDSSILCIGWMM